MPDPEVNEVYLALPYLNREGLEIYTRLLLRKMAQLVISSSTNLHDYEQEYSANPEVATQTLSADIEPETVWNLPVSYAVGTGQLRVTVSGYIMYPGIDYEEVGSANESSYKIKFKTHIDAGSIIGVVVYPKQFSFGRSINVSSLVTPEANVSQLPDNLISLDDEDALFVSRTEIQNAATSAAEACVHREGAETVNGLKTFTTVPKLDLSAVNLRNGEILPLFEAAYKANGLQYTAKPISVIAGDETDSAYSGTVMIGSQTGCTWIGAGDSFANLPMSMSAYGIDFANDESIVFTSDTRMTFFVGCSNDGANYTRALQIDEDGTSIFYGRLIARTMPNDDISTNAATTEFVFNTAVSLVGDESIRGVKTFEDIPMLPTAPLSANANEAANAEFVKGVCVSLTEDQNIEGQKNFIEDLQITNIDPHLNLTSNLSIKGQAPASTVESGVKVLDKNGISMGGLLHRHLASGSDSIMIQAVDPRDLESPPTADIGVTIDEEGKVRTFAPNPAVGDASGQIATTKFVADTLAVFAESGMEGIANVVGDTVYVSTDGSDDSNGASAAQRKTGGEIAIRVNAGEYSGGIDLNAVSCTLNISGRVKIIENSEGKSGITVRNGGSLVVNAVNEESQFVVSRTGSGQSGVNVVGNSHMHFNCNTSVEAVNADFGIRIGNGGSILADKEVAISANSIVHHAFSMEGGFASFNAPFRISGESIPNGIYASCSHLYFNSNLDESQASITQGGLMAVRNSAVALANGTSDIKAKSRTVYLESGAVLQIAGGTVSVTASESGECVHITRSSTAFMTANPAVTLNSAGTHAVFIDTSSTLELGNGSFTFSGTASSAVIAAYGQSLVRITPNAELSGNIAGPRYAMGSRAMIDVSGMGEERIPGTEAGYAAADQQTMYI